MVWSTLLGGPNYDRAYAVEVDKDGNVVVAGRAGPGFPTTPGSYQPNFQGYNTGVEYGYQNAFVAKLSPDGGNLLWSSYTGNASLHRDVAVDADGDIYVGVGVDRLNSTAQPPLAWFANGYQKTSRGGGEAGFVKIKADGTQVLGGSLFGGTGNEVTAQSIRVDANKNVYLLGYTVSTDLQTTPGAAQTTNRGLEDMFAAKFSSDGSQLGYSTYLGGSDREYLSTHNLAIDASGNAVVSIWTRSSDFVTTTSALDRSFAGGSDMAIVKLDGSGALLASTFIGGIGNENPDGIYVDAQGNIVVAGNTASAGLATRHSFLEGCSLNPRPSIW